MTYVRGQLRGRLTARLARVHRRWLHPTSGRRPGDRFPEHLGRRSDTGRDSPSAVSGSRTATAEVSGSVCSRTAPVSQTGGRGGQAAGHLSSWQSAADTSLATCAGHQPSGQRSFRKRRTVNPLTGPTRYNFFYSSFSRSALRAAACGGCPRPATTQWPLGTGRTLRTRPTMADTCEAGTSSSAGWAWFGHAPWTTRHKRGMADAAVRRSGQAAVHNSVGRVRRLGH
jgi:hypothetical protein